MYLCIKPKNWIYPSPLGLLNCPWRAVWRPGPRQKAEKNRNDLDRCDPLAVPRGDKPTKLWCFNHFTSFYLIFLPNFCSLPRSQPTGEEGKTHKNGPARQQLSLTWFGTGRGYGLVQDFPYFQPVLPWRLWWQSTTVVRQISHNTNQQDFLAAKWIVCWEWQWITRWWFETFFIFTPDPWGFMIQFDLRIFFTWVG